MSSNSSTSSPPGHAVISCCSATTLLGSAVVSFTFCFALLLIYLYLRFLVLQRRRRSAQELRRPKLGLDAAAIALLPSFPYRQAKTSTLAPVECSVCLNAVDEEEMVRQLPSCKHLFHQECIDVWLTSKATCPVCREKAEPLRVEEAAAAVSAVPSAYVVPVVMFEDEMAASSSVSEAKDMTGETESVMWARPERLGLGAPCRLVDLERQ